VLTKRSTTRQDIITLGEELIRSRGYHAFSYHDISSKLHIKNAAIHYHFPLKEDLGAAVVRKNIEAFEELLQDKKFNQLGEWERLTIFIDDIFGKYLSENRVCLVGALSTEFLTLPGIMQTEFKAMTTSIRNWLIALLKTGKRKNIFSYSTSAEAKALMIITSMIAGLQVARVMNKTDFHLIKNGILKELKTEE
jgi:TetR/AcrR family transcriptional repressor of nem operon